MTARSTLIRLTVLVAASLLLAGIALMIQVSAKRSASSAPPAVQDADAPTVARTAEPPAATIEARRANVSDVAPPLAAKEERPADPAGERPGVAGMVVGIDPETGKLGMPTPEQMKRHSDVEQRIDHDPADLVEVHHPDGSVSVDLQGRFQEYATVRIGPDGRKIFHCVDGRENAEKVLKGPAPGAPTEDAPAPQQPEER